MQSSFHRLFYFTALYAAVAGSSGCEEATARDPSDMSADAQVTEETTEEPSSGSSGSTGKGSTLIDAGLARDAARAGAVAKDAGASGDAGLSSQPLHDLRCQVRADLPARADYAKPGPYVAGKMEITFEDPSRPILPTGKHEGAPARKLVTTIHYPAASSSLLGSDPVAKGGPYPLLVYSHGYSSSRDESNAAGTHAATYGYVVVAPDFPLTNLLANGGAPDVTDASNQPGDVSFLIDQILALSRKSDHPLANAVDEARIGALGVSLGGLTTLLASFHPDLRDPRIKAAMPIAALSYFFGPGFYQTRALPSLFVHGDLDAFIDYEQNARRAFTRAAPNARLLTVTKGTHAGFAMPVGSSLLTSVASRLIAPADADPDNADGLGCGAVGETLAATGPEFLDALGGPEKFIETTVEEAKALLPCQGDEYKKPGMDPREQQQILARAVVAFFEAHLGKTVERREDGCRYLLHELPKNPALKLE